MSGNAGAGIASNVNVDRLRTPAVVPDHSSTHGNSSTRSSVNGRRSGENDPLFLKKKFLARPDYLMSTTLQYATPGGFCIGEGSQASVGGTLNIYNSYLIYLFDFIENFFLLFFQFFC